jgi:FG-GAP repeat protein
MTKAGFLSLVAVFALACGSDPSRRGGHGNSDDGGSGGSGADAGGGGQGGEDLPPATHFDTTAMSWRTPDGGFPAGGTLTGFYQVAGGDYDPGEQYWATLDLTGDGRPDLVVTAQDGDQLGTSGNRFWHVYPNDGAGFDPQPMVWSTPNGGFPAGGTLTGFYQVAGGDYDPGEQYWSTFDLTGDGRPDLVVTAQDGDQFSANGARAWKVYPNDGSGFDSAPIDWFTPSGGYPPGGTLTGFYQVAGGDYDPGEQYWSTFDITGDGRPDLVVTAQDGDQFSANGARAWKVYPNNGSGFDAAPIDWFTPSGGYPPGGTLTGFYQVAGGDYDPGEQYWSTFDLTGDGKPDLVVSAQDGDQFSSDGQRVWKVYPNDGGGFDPAPIEWATPNGGYPAGGTLTGFYQVAGGDYDPGEQYWSTVDLTGDRKPDLVISAQDGDQFTGDGVRFWNVYSNDGNGFAAEQLGWTTPDGGFPNGGTLTGFYQLAGGDYDPGEQYWSTFDITGDGRPDLVVTAQAGAEFGAPGDRSWMVYPGSD